jgi:hypothetical protein
MFTRFLPINASRVESRPKCNSTAPGNLLDPFNTSHIHTSASTQMDDSPNPPELIERFGSQPPDIMGELQSMLRIYDIDAQELFFKWESYSMKMGPDDINLTYDTVLAFKKDVQELLEKEQRGKARMQQTPAVQRTIQPQAARADPFAL